jgi:4-amino-4-deoxy-L-arabinose transferase-like glycosyltransferase
LTLSTQAASLPVPDRDVPAERSFAARYFKVLLLVIVLLSAWARLYRLSEYPQRFEADEINMGYEAWSLWTTAADQYGSLLPLHIRGFNEYSPGLPLYMAVPFVGLLGPSEFSARLPFALMGILTVYLTAILGRRWFGHTVGLLAALFLSVDPWHVNFTRVALLVGAVPLFTVLALLAFTRFIDTLDSETATPRIKVRWAVLCGLGFALLTLTYSPMKLQTPLLMAGCVAAAWTPLRENRRLALIALGAYVVFLSPLIYDQLAHWSEIQHHFGQVSVFTMPDPFLRIWRNYAAQYNPSALLFDGLNRTLGYKPAYGTGELFWLEGPLWIVAFVGLLRYPLQRLNLPVLLGVWAVTYPIASSLTWGPTAHREINALPLPELLAGYGAVLVLNWLSRTRFGRRAVIYSLIVATFIFVSFCLLFFGSFFHPPFLETDAVAEVIPYNIGLRQTLQYVTEHSQPCDHIWMDPTYQTYVIYLFYTRYPPARFQKADVVKYTTHSGWLQVPRVENVDFQMNITNMPSKPDCAGKPASLWFLGKSGKINEPGWKEVFTVNNGVGDVIWRVQVKQS